MPKLHESRGYFRTVASKTMMVLRTRRRPATVDDWYVDKHFGDPLMDPWCRGVPKSKELSTESRVEPAKLTTSVLTPIDTRFCP